MFYGGSCCADPARVLIGAGAQLRSKAAPPLTLARPQRCFLALAHTCAGGLRLFTAAATDTKGRERIDPFPPTRRRSEPPLGNTLLSCVDLSPNEVPLRWRTAEGFWSSWFQSGLGLTRAAAGVASLGEAAAALSAEDGMEPRRKLLRFL